MSLLFEYGRLDRFRSNPIGPGAIAVTNRFRTPGLGDVPRDPHGNEPRIVQATKVLNISRKTRRPDGARRVSSSSMNATFSSANRVLGMYGRQGYWSSSSTASSTPSLTALALP